MAIIMSERLGYEIEVGLGDYSYTAVNALAGCQSSQDTADACIASTLASPPIWHFSFETWANAESVFKAWRGAKPDLVPIKLGPMGYKGTEGHFVEAESQATAFHKRGLSLDWFRSYDADWTDPAEFFTNISTFSRDLFVPCLQGLPSNYLVHYSKHFQHGVSHVNGTYTPICPEDDDLGDMSGIWWLSPACQEDISKCVPYVADPWNWGTHVILQMAVQWNMPVAIATSKDSSSWKALVRENRVMTYHWIPDGTFAGQGVDLTQVLFLPYSSKQWVDENLKVTNWDREILYKWAAPGLSRAAADAFALASNAEFQLETINGFFLELAAGRSQYEVACSWVTNNTDVWQTWLMSELECIDGQGLVDAAGIFLADATNAIRCDWCPLGRVSMGIDGGSKVCVACAAGTFMPQPGQAECLQCEVGKYSGTSESSECQECPLGAFTDSRGMSGCSACAEEAREDSARWTTWRKPSGTDLWIRASGATSREQCGCSSGAWLTDDGACRPCTTGMECPAMGELYLQPGYFSTSDRRDYIYQCHSDHDFRRCPGGLPGTCGARRLNTSFTCLKCEGDLTSTADGECVECSGEVGSLFIVFAIVVLTLGLAVIYSFLAADNRAKGKHTTEMVMIPMSLLITSVQIISVLQVLTVPWPIPFKTVLDVSGVFSFRLSLLKLDCLLPGTSSPVFKYCERLLALLVMLVEMCVIHAGHVFLLHTPGRDPKKFCRALRARRPVLITSVGAVFFSVFIAISRTIFIPFQCESHPNGVQTLVSNPRVVCWDADSQDHRSLVLIASACSLIPTGFLAIVFWAVVQLPGRLDKGDTDFLRQFSFLFCRLRTATHWYAGVLVLRNLFIALVPVVPEPSMQVSAVCLLMLPTLLLGPGFLPWRHPIGNVLEAASNVCIILIVFMGALFIPITDTEALAMGCTVLLIGMVITLFIAAVIGVGLHISGLRDKGSFFLCHHKSTSCLARLLKWKLTSGPGACGSVFLPADHLGQLGSTFRKVVDSNVVVAVLSPEILTCPWCMGELVMARDEDKTTLLLKLPDFCFVPPHCFRKEMELVEGLEKLTAFGFNIDSVIRMLEWLPRNSGLVLPAAPTAASWDSLVDLLLRWDPGDGASDPDGLNWGTTIAMPTDTNVILLVNHSHLEAHCTAVLLKEMLEDFFDSRWHFRPHVLGQGETFPPTATGVLVIISSECFEDPFLSSQIKAAVDARARCLPIIADVGFSHHSTKPGRSRASRSAVLVEQVEPLNKVVQEMLADNRMPFYPLENQRIVNVRLAEIAAFLQEEEWNAGKKTFAFPEPVRESSGDAWQGAGSEASEAKSILGIEVEPEPPAAFALGLGLGNGETPTRPRRTIFL